MKTFFAFTKKELLEQYRSGKLLFLGISDVMTNEKDNLYQR